MIRLSFNENPFGFPKQILERVIEDIDPEEIARYTDAPIPELSDELVRYIRDTSRVDFIDERWISITSGSDEGITILMSMRPKRVVLFPPTYFCYYNYAKGMGLNYVEFYLVNDKSIPQVELEEGDMVFVPNPNNPTGHMFSAEEIERLLKSPALIVLDEAYFEFSWVSSISFLRKYDNLLILRTFSKAFAFAGQRFGYVIAHPHMIEKFNSYKQTYNVGVLTQKLALEALKNRWLFFGMIKEIEMERERMREAIEDMGLEVFPSYTNFLYFKVENAHDVQRALFERGVEVRALWGGIRVSVGKKEENDEFIKALREIIR